MTRTLSLFRQEYPDVFVSIKTGNSELVLELLDKYEADINKDATAANNNTNQPGDSMDVLNHVGDGFAQFGKGVWGMVEGLGGLAAGVGKTVYDGNPIGQTVDLAEQATGTDLPDWLPSADRGQQRINNAAQSMVDLGKAVWDDPSLLIAEYKALAEDDRYGAIVDQAAADVGELMLDTKGTGKAAKATSATALMADADKLSRAANSATDLAKLAAANPEFAAKGTNVLAQTRAVLETVDDSALSAVARSNLDESKALIDDVLEISAPRDANIGNPAAIANGFGELSARQSRMLGVLLKSGSRVTLHKSDVSMTDIAALTAKTGDEFAIFTRGSQRTVMRDDTQSVSIEPKEASDMKEQGWRWSAHTQPGLETRHTIASAGDQAVLKAFGQEHSLIMNSRGQTNVFSPTETLGLQP